MSHHDQLSDPIAAQFGDKVEQVQALLAANRKVEAPWYMVTVVSSAPPCPLNWHGLHGCKAVNQVQPLGQTNHGLQHLVKAFRAQGFLLVGA